MQVHHQESANDVESTSEAAELDNTAEGEELEADSDDAPQTPYLEQVKHKIQNGELKTASL